MANTKSAIKMIRVAQRKRARNKPLRSALKTFVTRAESTIAQQDKEAARTAVIKAITALDRAAEKGIVHPNNAARRKSRLMKKLNVISA